MTARRICVRCSRQFFGDKEDRCVVCRAKLSHRSTGGSPGRPMGAGKRATANIELLRSANLEVLSPRLRAVAERVKDGQTCKQIADELGVAIGTVQVECGRAYAILRARRTQGAAA